MKKEIIPTFIHELKIKPTPSDLKTLNIRLDVARQMYNACLGESLTRLQLMRESKNYQCALKLPKQKNKAGNLVANKNRQQLFKQAKYDFRFSEYAIHVHLTKVC